MKSATSSAFVTGDTSDCIPDRRTDGRADAGPRPPRDPLRPLRPPGPAPRPPPRRSSGRARTATLCGAAGTAAVEGAGPAERGAGPG